MPKRAATQLDLFVFAIWALRRRRPPNVPEIREHFGVSLDSARRIFRLWIKAQHKAAVRIANACAARINSRENSRRRQPATAQLETES